MASNLTPAQGISLTASYQTVYTCPANTTATVLMLHASNSHASSISEVYVQWLDASNANAAMNLAAGVTIPVKAAFMVLGNQKLVLGAGDVIQAKRGTDGSIDLTISVMEQA